MHILTVDQFTRKDVEDFCQRADALRRSSKSLIAGKNKILTNLFYEASTRTSSSFQAAMYKLGGNVVSINDVNYSSVSKGENLEDTIRTMACYSDVIVLRHPEIGAAQRASLVSSVPIINAGDGAGEHPTQALLDFYTIWREQESVEGITVTLIGDLKHGRTVHSLSKLLRMWDVKFNFISPPSFTMPDEYVKAGDYQSTNLSDVIKDTDVLYVTRVQKERIVPVLGLAIPVDIGSDMSYGVGLDDMAVAKNTMSLMHPLPRNEEIPAVIDDDPRAAYFRQMENGLWMRTALLEKVLTQV